MSRKHLVSIACVVMLAVLFAVVMLVQPARAATPSVSTVVVVPTPQPRVPNVVGVSGKAAVTVLTNAGYKVYVGKPVYSSTIKKWCVVSTTPKGGSVLPRRATVTIYTSLGKKPAHKSHSWKSGKSSTYGGSREAQGTAGSYLGCQSTRSFEKYHIMYFAHKTMKFGTKIHFRYNGHEVIGVCVDRGPYVRGRVFDLGYNTAKALHFSGVGAVSWDYE